MHTQAEPTAFAAPKTLAYLLWGLRLRSPTTARAGASLAPQVRPGFARKTCPGQPIAYTGEVTAVRHRPPDRARVALSLNLEHAGFSALLHQSAVFEKATS